MASDLVMRVAVRGSAAEITRKLRKIQTLSPVEAVKAFQEVQAESNRAARALRDELDREKVR